jgi:hypothetical protein
MSISKKHFTAFAEELRAIRPRPDQHDAVTTANNYIRFLMWRDCTAAIASACGEFSPSFDYRRFYEAAGYHEPFLPEPTSQTTQQEQQQP